MSADKEIGVFSCEEIPTFLRAKLRHYLESTFHFQAEIEFPRSPRMFADIHTTDNKIVVSISEGWIRRTTIIFHLIEAMWKTSEVRPKVTALNTANVFDAFFWRPDVDECNFLSVPDLAPLFQDTLPVQEHDTALANFCSKFNTDHGGKTLGGGTYLLDFVLPDDLSKETKKQVELCFEFLLLHELHHIGRGHRSILGIENSVTLSERSQQTWGNPYLKKAIELDADVSAFITLMNDRSKLFFLDAERHFSEIIRPLCIFIPCFDICVHSLADYQTRYSSHPLPDIRVHAAVMNAANFLYSHGADFRSLFRRIFEDSVVYSVRSFQQLSIPNGPYFISAPRLQTIDQQFYPEIFSFTLINEEIFRIDMEHNAIRTHNREPIRSAPILFDPIGYTIEKFKEKAIAYAKDFFQGNLNVESKEEADNIRTLFLKSARETMKSGDYLILSVDQSKRSPYLDFEILESGGTEPTKIDKEFHMEFERVSYLTMQILCMIAEVKTSTKN
ncbi:hypothetical protein [Rhizobium sp. RU36D]|uniref:hypothetical protein n=1 Tax=Rhizobium sp. RU36D TaxID=1907415 RepID=UPI0009D8C2DD|nr:hypothetical protein [Rhizobium sp. RU36D]SMD17461.1 hypothetical protein SAMN05880593_13262 [Rhizobium sp. RU36D]